MNARLLLKVFLLAAGLVMLLGCATGIAPDFLPGNDDTSGADGDSDSDSDADSDADSDSDGDPGPSAPQYAELWYSSGDSLVYINLDESDGTVVDWEESAVSGLDIGQNSLTLLDDGSLVGARITDTGDGFKTQFYHIPDPPRDGSAVTPVQLGTMPDKIGLEAVYTDCDGRLYGMDTGVDWGSSTGNRLLRFTGDYLAGDFTYAVVSDLSSASVADIDDMGPGIDSEGMITDNPGFAIDTGHIYDFNYQTGTGTEVATGGDWGVHALGGELFDDGKSRMYILSREAELYEVDPSDYQLSGVLTTGPDTTADFNGHSGLAGPLTDCTTGFVPI